MENFQIALMDFFDPVCEYQIQNTRLARLAYSLPTVQTNYDIFNIRFTGTRIWNNIDDSLKNIQKKIEISTD